MVVSQEPQADRGGCKDFLIDMEINEKELEDYIYKNHNEIDFLEGSHIIRQFPLKGYGILDILIIDYSCGYPIYKIIELKKEFLDEKSISQISRYICGLKRNINQIKEKIPNENDKNNPFIDNFQIKGILVGKEFLGDSCYTSDQIESLDVLFYSLSLENGIVFNSNTSGWFNKKEKINQSLEKITKKAYIKYKYGQAH